MAYAQPNYWEEEDPLALSTRYGPRPTFHVKPADAPMPNDEGWGSPPEVAISPAIGPMPGAPRRAPRIAAEDPFFSDWNSAAARRDAHISAKPKLGDKQYERPTWQKALLAGANAYAGYVNAGRRTHINPVSDQTLLSRPKYDAAMDAWETQGRAIDSELGSLQSKYAMRRQAGTMDRQDRLTDSQIAENEAQAQHWLNPPQARPPQPIGTSRGIWDPATRGIVPGTEPLPPRPPNPPQLRPESVLLDPNASAPQKEMAQKILDAKTKRNERRGPAGPRPETPTQLAARDHQNHQELEKLEKRERGDSIEGTPGLHQIRTELGEKMKSGKAAPGDVAQFNQVNSELRSIFKRKLQMQAITREEYDSMIQGLQDVQAGGPPKAAAPGQPPASSRGAGPPMAAAPPTSQKMRKPLTAYDSR